jgi:hypothetical protein
VLHEVEVEVVAEVVQVTGIGVVQLVETEDGGATVEVVGSEEGWAGLETIAVGNAEVKPRMAKAMAGVERCILGREKGGGWKSGSVSIEKAGKENRRRWLLIENRYVEMQGYQYL